MALMPGTHLGPYQVTAQIGVGGMGEVYRATDTNLKRDVAIKVLPTAVATDPDRLARFQREAQVLAALNHPNIAQIHGLEKADGATALVMELVEGPTLADRIAKGPIPVDEALSMAKQIAEALEAAHDRGIVHRDLKPANVKVRNDGMVKVLDFGLAKALDPAHGSGLTAQDNATQSPTITSPAMTQAGFILGTAAYMAPEQAKGKPVDKRADIWAFGCVLYEMLTGHRAFAGSDVSEVLASVLAREPDWTVWPASTSLVLETYVRRCLQKDPKHRIHDIADVRLALEGAFDMLAPQAAAAVTLAPPAWRRALPLAATAITGAVVAGLLAWTVWPTVQPQGVTRFDYEVPADRPFRNAGRTVLALSPSARAFVYNSQGGLYLRTMDALEARAIPGTESLGLGNPFFSPDGQWVGFQQSGQGLKRIPIGGGAPADICPATALFGASWEADGTILFGQPAGILRVSAEGGEPQLVIPVAEGERLYGPRLLPGGNAVLFTSTTATWDDAQVVAQSLATGTRTVLVPRGADARYLPSGHLIYAQGTALFAVAFDIDRLAVTGAPVSVLQGVGRSLAGATAAAVYDVSDTGTLVYGRGLDVRRQLTWVDRRGAVLGTLGPPDDLTQSPSLSPDGKRAAVWRQSPLGTDLWIVDGLRATQVTFGKGAASLFPVWSPDGSRIAYLKSHAGQRRSTYVVPSTGAGKEEALFENSEVYGPTSWSRDGRFILTDRAGGANDVWVIPVGGDRKPFPFLSTPVAERLAQFSSDGRWVAYQSSESGGQAEIFVRPFNAPDDPKPRTGQWRVSTDGGVQARWRHDGKELYWIAPDATLMAAAITLGSDTVDVGVPVKLFPTRILGGFLQNSTGEYAVAPDGRLLINTVVASDGAQGRIVIVENWFEELKRLVPTR
jgi:Tol biopolymer transport system component